MDKIDGSYEWINTMKTWYNKEDSEILHPYKAHKKTEKLVSKITETKVKNTVPDNFKTITETTEISKLPENSEPIKTIFSTRIKTKKRGARLPLME